MNLPEVRQASANQARPIPSVKSTTLEPNDATLNFFMLHLAALVNTEAFAGFQRSRHRCIGPKHNVMAPYQMQRYYLRMYFEHVILSTTVYGNSLDTAWLSYVPHHPPFMLAKLYVVNIVLYSEVNISMYRTATDDEADYAWASGVPSHPLMIALSTSQQSLWLPSLTRPNRKSTSTHFIADVSWSGTTRI